MRIAYLTHYPELYGANRSLLDLLLELRRRGVVDPFVVAPRAGAITERLAMEGVPFHITPFEPWMSQRRYSGRFYHHWLQHRTFERAARARVRINQDLLPGLTDQLLRWKIDAIHANSAAVGMAPALKRTTGKPLIWHIRELPERQYLLHLDAGRSGYAKALRQADRTIAISKAVAEDIASYTTLPRSASVIYNGVLPRARYADLRERSPMRWTSTSPFVFTLVGLIHPSKGHAEALQALSLVRNRRPNVRLVIAGDGPDAAVRRTIQALRLDDIVAMKGFVPDTWPILEQAHALLMCSRNEAMGRITVEAMASGLPVIGHASGGTMELITDGVNGLLYPGGAEELAQRMLHVIDRPAAARALGDTASRMAEERFSIERYADDVLEVYRSVLSGSSTS